MNLQRRKQTDADKFRQLRRGLTPHRVNVPIDPPPISQLAWVNTAVDLAFSTTNVTTTFNISQVLSALRVKYGLSSDTTAFIAKLQGIKVWARVTRNGNASFTPLTLLVDFHNPDETDGYAIMSLKDVSDTTHAARVGFNYGEVNATRIISLDGTAKLATCQVLGIDLTATGTKMNLLCRVSLSWSYATSA